MPPLRLRVLIALLLAPAAAFAVAQQVVLELDPAQTKVEYKLGAVLHTVEGTFTLKRGRISFDPDSGKAAGELVVDAASGQSGNDSRDRNMHKNVLESERYPEIVFRPDRVEGKVAPQGRSQVQLHGTFTIHGADHEMTVPVDVEIADGRYTASAHFQIPYVKWGMKNPSTFVLRVSDKVDLTVHTVIARSMSLSAFLKR
jgi:polyisoprenoid-binding protein YceI